MQCKVTPVSFAKAVVEIWKILLVSLSWTDSDFIFQEYNKYTHNKIALHWLSTLLKYNTKSVLPLLFLIWTWITGAGG